MTLDKMIEELEGYGFTIGQRDPRVNKLHPGRFMVIEPYEDDMLPTEDGSNGPWAVVGDNLRLLIEQAYDMASTFYKEA